MRLFYFLDELINKSAFYGERNRRTRKLERVPLRRALRLAWVFSGRRAGKRR